MLSCFQCSPEDVDQQAEEKHRAARACFRENVQQQQVNSLKEKQCQYENKLIDKKRLDDVLQTIYDDDVSERQLKEDIAGQQRKDMETYRLGKSSWHEKQKIMIIDEDKQIKKHERKMQDQSSSEKDAKAKNQSAREAQSVKVGKKNFKDQLAKEERDNILSSFQQHESMEKGVQYDISRKMSMKAGSDELTSGLDSQVSDHKAEAVKQKMKDYAYGVQQHEYREKGLQYDFAQKLDVKAAADKLASGLDAQLSDHKAEALKQKVDDQAYGEKQHEYRKKGVQNDIAQKLNERAASAELASGLDAQLSDHEAEAVKQKLEDYAFREKMMEGIEEARLQEEEEKNIIMAKNKIYGADLRQQIEDNKKRREKERHDM